MVEWVETDLTVSQATYPPDPAGLLIEGGEVMQLYIEGSLTIPKVAI